MVVVDRSRSISIFDVHFSSSQKAGVGSSPTKMKKIFVFCSIPFQISLLLTFVAGRSCPVRSFVRSLPGYLFTRFIAAFFAKSLCVNAFSSGHWSFSFCKKLGSPRTTAAAAKKYFSFIDEEGPKKEKCVRATKMNEYILPKHFPSSSIYDFEKRKQNK